MQKLIFLRIGLVLNLLEDAVGRLARARARARSRTAGLNLSKGFQQNVLFWQYTEAVAYFSSTLYTNLVIEYKDHNFETSVYTPGTPKE